MKRNNRYQKGAIALVAAAAVALAACKDSSNTADGGGEKPGDSAPAPATKTIAEKIIGQWGVDKDATLKSLEGASDVDPAMAAMAKPMIEKIAGMIALEVRKDGSSFHAPGEVKEGPYTMADVDESAGTFTLTMDGESRSVVLKGDTMTAKADGEPAMVFNRIDAAEFKSRSEKAAAFNPASLLEGLGGGAEELGAEIQKALEEAIEGAGGEP